MSQERLKKLTLQDGERRATLLTWRFTGVADKGHPRSRIICLENRWDSGLLISYVPETRALRRASFDGPT
jgi:hypothetical protein